MARVFGFLVVSVLFVSLSMQGCTRGSRFADASFRVQLMRAPLVSQISYDDKSALGIWRDMSGSIIVAVHKAGEELRYVIAAGDTRKIITGPWTDKIRQKAARMMDAWASGDDRLTSTSPRQNSSGWTFVLAGKKIKGKAALGFWAFSKHCAQQKKAQGHFYSRIGRDKESGTLVMMLSVLALRKKSSGGLGGDRFEFRRDFILVKREGVRVKPSLLRRMSEAKHFCRKK